MPCSRGLIISSNLLRNIMREPGVIKVRFKENRRIAQLYKDRHIEIRKSGNQTRYYEVDSKGGEYCITKDTVKWLMHIGSLPRNKILKNSLKRKNHVNTND